jgi:hypothetical protein
MIEESKATYEIAIDNTLTLSEVKKASRIGYIYELVCKDKNIIKKYIGSTFDIINRCKSHTNSSNNPKYQNSLYIYIRDNNGIDNFQFIILEQVNCDSRRDLFIRERYHIEQQDINILLNKTLPVRYSSEMKQIKETYYNSNKPRLLEYSSNNYNANREKRLKQFKAYYQKTQLRLRSLDKK